MFGGGHMAIVSSTNGVPAATIQMPPAADTAPARRHSTDLDVDVLVSVALAAGFSGACRAALLRTAEKCDRHRVIDPPLIC